MQTEKFRRSITGILVQPQFCVSGHIISLLASKDQSGFGWNATSYHSSLLWHTANQCTVRRFPFTMPQALSLTLAKGPFTSSLLIFSFSFHIWFQDQQRLHWNHDIFTASHDFLDHQCIMEGLWALMGPFINWPSCTIVWTGKDWIRMIPEYQNISDTVALLKFWHLFIGRNKLCNNGSKINVCTHSMRKRHKLYDLKVHKGSTEETDASVNQTKKGNSQFQRTGYTGSLKTWLEAQILRKPL